MRNTMLDLLHLQEAMDMLNVSRATIDRWRKHKQLPYIKIGKEIFLEKAKLQKWIEQHAQTVGSGPSSYAPSGTPTITVGYQSSAALLWTPLLIKQFGWFEEELLRLLPSASIRVQWVNAPNGIELVEELIAGRVQIASVGDYPMMASHALSGILPKFQSVLLAFDGKTQNGSGISIMVPSGSSVRHWEELTNGSISTVANSSASCRLDGWMKSQGLHTRQVVYRQMGDCLNALVERSVGASVMWEPYLSWAQAIGAGVPLFEEGMGGDYLTGLIADQRWAENNEAVVVAYLKAHLRAHAFMRKEPQQASQVISQASGFPAPVVAWVMSRVRWDASLYSRDVRTLGQLEPVSSLHEARYVQKGGDLILNKRYLQLAAEALKLPGLPDIPLPGEWSQDLIY